MKAFYQNNKKLIWIGAGIIVLAGAYWYWQKKKKEKEAVAPTVADTIASKAASAVNAGSALIKSVQKV